MGSIWLAQRSEKYRLPEEYQLLVVDSGVWLKLRHSILVEDLGKYAADLREDNQIKFVRLAQVAQHDVVNLL